MQTLLKTRNIAELYRVSINTVLNWIYSGKLKAYRTPGGHYRISQQDLQIFARRYRQTPLGVEPVGGISPSVLLVEVGSMLFNQFRHSALARWPDAKIVHARTLFDTRFLLERFHPDYVVIHPTLTPPALVAHCKDVSANRAASTPLLITLSNTPETSIATCIRQIEREVIGQYSRDTKAHLHNARVK
jgi:excisionase family DNA binding protein